MARIRLSTTVDPDLLAAARGLDPRASDASVVEQALRALLAQHDRVRIDQDYERAYAEQPPDTVDAWGDLSSWREGAART